LRRDVQRRRLLLPPFYAAPCPPLRFARVITPPTPSCRTTVERHRLYFAAFSRHAYAFSAEARHPAVTPLILCCHACHFGDFKQLDALLIIAAIDADIRRCPRQPLIIYEYAIDA